MITPGHKRELNRALHELRRPVQALVLLEEESEQRVSPRETSRRGLLELVAGALRDLDGALNGGSAERSPVRFSCREAMMACVERWPRGAVKSGGVRIYWDAGPAIVEGDPARLAQALDNLIANAIEHGDPPILVTGARVAGKLRITVANGLGKRPSARNDDPRHGHGTEVVSRVASSHGGRFALCHTGSGCVAALELPLAEPGYARAA